ncbi:MAG: transcriptional repressor [Gracilimonas sp.]
MNNEVLIQELTDKDIRPTAVRLRVLNKFRSYNEAFSLNELEHELNPVDRSTLFRTLKTFEERGVIHTVNEEKGQVKYAICAKDCSCSYDDHMHVHFNCESCLKTYCLYDVRLKDVDLPSGFKPMDANVVIKGYCNACSAA